MRLKKAIASTFLTIILVFVVEGTKEDDVLDLETQIKQLDKPAIKSIKDENGGIIDCIDIYQQPAFDHPLLKNHTIQMKPSAFPKELMKGDDDLGIQFHAWFRTISCPKGSVPIPRTTKEQLITMNNISRLIHINSPNSNSASNSKYYFATVSTAHNSIRQYYGVRAMINNRRPTVLNDQSSAAAIWIKNGPANELNSIQIGWMVIPRFYGDNIPRVYSYWTADASKKTGCFNFHCPGFVQVGSEVVFGEQLHSGRYGGRQQYSITPVIFKDPRSGNWWLAYAKGSKMVSVGYWPNSIFTHLKNFATSIDFGGRVHGNVNEPAPEMGSGHFELVDPTKTCYISQIYVIIDTSNKFVEPKGMSMLVSADSCYLASYVGYSKQPILRYAMMFGGPVHEHCVI